MVGFGELRRLSLKWQTDIPAVERVYALDWLLKAIFEQPPLSQALAVQGATALGKAYFSEYPAIPDLDMAGPLAGGASLETDLGKAVAEATRQSGLSFRVHSVAATQARFEFAGPLGRRSAAQPQIVLRLFKEPLASDPVTVPLIHPFSEPLNGIVRAISLEEIAARYIAILSTRPRARDVFDLWFILHHGRSRLNIEQTRSLAADFARQRGRSPGARLDPAYRAVLERAWNNALKQFPAKPSFAQSEADINSALTAIL